MFRTTYGSLTLMWAGQLRKQLSIEQRNFFISKCRGQNWESLTLLFNPYRALFPPDIKRPERGTDH
jgi:hypothetical protein